MQATGLAQVADVFRVHDVELKAELFEHLLLPLNLNGRGADD